jgi:hypothetical protein
MFSHTKIQENQALGASEITGTNQADNCETLQKQELRRQMYERIAQGNALSELENTAFRQRNK